MPLRNKVIACLGRLLQQAEPQRVFQIRHLSVDSSDGHRDANHVPVAADELQMQKLLVVKEIED